MKRATRSAMLAAVTEVGDLLYEVAWRERAPAEGPESARLPAGSAAGAERTAPFADYLQAEGVPPAERLELLADLDRLSRAYAVAAFKRLDCGWRAGAAVEPQALADALGVGAGHRSLFARLIAMLGEAGVLAPRNRRPAHRRARAWRAGCRTARLAIHSSWRPIWRRGIRTAGTRSGCCAVAARRSPTSCWAAPIR